MAQDKLTKTLLATISADKWKRIGAFRRSGVLVPLFSVYSKDSIGLGDLRDLNILIDWCKKTGNSILQLLPMNETGPNFCPYDAVSSFAIEPLYISMEPLTRVKSPAITKMIDDLKASYPPGGPYVNYKVKAAKLAILREIYLKGADKGSKDIRGFRKENSYWLDDFALFKVLKGHHEGKPWYLWEERYRDREMGALRSFWEAHEEEIGFEMWLQWTAYQQFKEAKACAKSNGVLLKGDLPIFISRDSADVWAHRELFKLELAAGAPPDMYCAKGQRWGMPTYDWPAIEADGYRYLKEKLFYAENFYDMLRIDHVVGLFRVWSIPYDDPSENMGLNGHFEPQDEALWRDHGRRILSVMLDATKMLLLAEDLGVIPKACPETLGEFGIPGNDVQRWTKDWNTSHDFLLPEEFRLLSVAMLSTHDTTNFRAWWEYEAGTVDALTFRRKCAEKGVDFEGLADSLFDKERSKHNRMRWRESVSSVDVFLSMIGRSKAEAPELADMYENTYGEKEKLWKMLRMKGAMKESSSRDLTKAAINFTLASNSIFAINSIRDWMGMSGILKGDPYQYRINTPGTVSEKNWSLVLPISLEELLRHEASEEISRIVRASSRR